MALGKGPPPHGGGYGQTKTAVPHAWDGCFANRRLVDVDEDAGAVIPLAPVAMMILMHDEGVVAVVAVVVTVVIVRPGFVVDHDIIGQTNAGKAVAKRGDEGGTSDNAI